MLNFDETGAVHKCGFSYAYCNGNCNDCPNTNTWATTSTDAISRYAQPDYDCDAFGKPSKEVYEKAKKDKEFASNALWASRKRRDELIDALAKERESEKLYMELYEKHRDIIRKYEIYEELQNG